MFELFKELLKDFSRICNICWGSIFYSLHIFFYIQTFFKAFPWHFKDFLKI